MASSDKVNASDLASSVTHPVGPEIKLAMGRLGLLMLGRDDRGKSP